MYVRFAMSLNSFAKNTTRYLGVFTFLTLGLTNCGKSGPSNNIALELEEDFPTDDISALPLEEQDLVDLSSLGKQYYAIEAEPSALKDKNRNILSKHESEYIYSKDERTFTVKDHIESSDFNMDVIYESVSVYDAKAPYDLLKKSISREVKLPAKGTQASKVIKLKLSVECSIESCDMKGENDSIPIQDTIFKKGLAIQNLKEFLLETLVARHKFDVKRIRLNTDLIDIGGLRKEKRIYYFSNPTSHLNMESSRITRSFNPFIPVKYTFNKLSNIHDRSGLLLEASMEIRKLKKVSEFYYKAITELGRLADESIVKFIPPATKTFKFATALLTGDGRFRIRDTYFQKVQHLAEHTEVELLSAPPYLDSIPPSPWESSNTLKSPIPLEWQEEIGPVLAEQPTTKEKAQTILDYLTYKLKYSKMNGTFSTEEVFDIKKGDCSEFAKTFVALARQYGITARKRTGIATNKNLYLNSKNEVVAEGGAHAWAEYFDAEAGTWVYIDGAMYSHGHNTGYYILDLGDQGNHDYEKESYLSFEDLIINYVFDEESKKQTIEKITQP